MFSLAATVANVRSALLPLECYFLTANCAQQLRRGQHPESGIQYLDLCNPWLKQAQAAAKKKQSTGSRRIGM
jgi:hypothetical protein